YISLPFSHLHPFPTRRSSDLRRLASIFSMIFSAAQLLSHGESYPAILQNYAAMLTETHISNGFNGWPSECWNVRNKRHPFQRTRSEEHKSELQSLRHLVCRLL